MIHNRVQKPVSSSTTAKCHLETSKGDFQIADSSFKNFGQWEFSEWRLSAMLFAVKTYGFEYFSIFDFYFVSSLTRT